VCSLHFGRGVALISLTVCRMNSYSFEADPRTSCQLDRMWALGKVRLGEIGAYAA
jgi:hypothetical protein